MTLSQNEEVERAAYEQSLALLRRCLTPAGFVAALSDVDNYARVWARDGVICGLAGLASGEVDLVEGMGRTLQTLTAHQGPHGEIPSNVTVDGTQVSFGRLVGRVDALLWYVIGVCAYLQQVGNDEQRAFYQTAVERALWLAECWEFNNRGFIYTPLAGNWADEYVQQGYVLAEQLLHLLALQGAGRLFDKLEWREKAVALRSMIEVNYWPREEFVASPLVYHLVAYRLQVEQGRMEHWLSSLSPSGYMTVFDGMAHALMSIANVGSSEQRERSEQYVQGIARTIGSDVLPAFWPVIQPGGENWTMLTANHLFGEFKNGPYSYHNGGLWPMLSGLYTMGLVRQGWVERARAVLMAINEANEQGRDGDSWEFAEYHYGDAGSSHEPLGTKYTAWSAAAGVLAYQAVHGGSGTFQGIVEI